MEPRNHLKRTRNNRSPYPHRHPLNKETILINPLLKVEVFLLFLALRSWKPCYHSIFPWERNWYMQLSFVRILRIQIYPNTIYNCLNNWFNVPYKHQTRNNAYWSYFKQGDWRALLFCITILQNVHSQVDNWNIIAFFSFLLRILDIKCCQELRPLDTLHFDIMEADVYIILMSMPH